MRKHFIFVLKEGDRVPGGGSPLSWLEYYKLNLGNGETYLPFTEEGRLAQKGDILWIMYERVLLARVVILRVMDDMINGGRPEVWYGTRFLKILTEQKPVEGPEYTTGIVDPIVGEFWLTLT